MLNINIFLLCYNEELLLPLTLKHYKSRFPSATIYLIDNESTDNSVQIAKDNGCIIRSYSSNNQQDEQQLIWIRTHVWKEFVKEGWIIMCDMDEWLDMDEYQLNEEDYNGTTIININGVNMVGESKTTDLSDIILSEINRGFYDDSFSKKICFKYPAVNIEFWWGAHKCWTFGNVKYSNKKYLLKHYNYLGENYLIEKHRKRYVRNEKSRSIGINKHYLNDTEKIKAEYRNVLNNSVNIY